MPFDQLEDPLAFGSRRRVIALAQKPQAPHAVLVDELTQRRLVSVGKHDSMVVEKPKQTQLPQKFEMVANPFWSDDERLTLLALLLENVGAVGQSRGLGGPTLDVDLSLVMAGFGFETVWTERRVFVVDGVDIPVARLPYRRIETCGRSRQGPTTRRLAGNRERCITSLTLWYYRPMRTISLKLPDEVDAKLEAQARRTGRTKSAITREALSRFLEEDVATGVSCLDLVRDLVGTARGPGDLSSNKKFLRGYGR